MTPDLLAAVRSYKAPLLEILSESASSAHYADREWDRFLACAIPTPDGDGLYDPTQEPVPMSGYVVPHPDDSPPGVPPGWSVAGWRKHMQHMAEACEQDHADMAAEYRRKAEEIDRHT